MDADLEDQLSNFSPSSVSGTFYRMLREEYSEDVLSMTGSLQVGGRYNPPKNLERSILERRNEYAGARSGGVWVLLRTFPVK